MKISDILDPLPPDLARILGPKMPPKLRAEMIDVFRRDPPPQMSPEERHRMYHPDADREEAELRKLNAEADKAEAEAARARAEAAAAHRSNRSS